jgi:hypothetical protein
MSFSEELGMTIDPQLLASLSFIPWFEQCGGSVGRPFTFRVRQLSDWSEVRAALSGDWGNQTEEAQGRLTEYLSDRFPQLYQGVWNRLVREVRPQVESTVGIRAKALSLVNGLGQPFVDAATWDVLAGVMEMSYRAQNPPVFFSRLFDVYRAGHFPCGMEEDGTMFFI